MLNNPKAPFVRTEDTAGHMTRDVLICALPLVAFSVFNYGFRPLWIVLFSLLSALAAEMVCCLIRHKPLSVLRDGSAAVTGVILGLLMSPAAAYWVPMVGSAFAIFVAKAPFGGTGRNVFNPAAAGIAILSYVTPRRMFLYPAIDTTVSLPTTFNLAPEKIVTASSLAGQLRSGAVPSATQMQLLVGDFSGPIGATAVLILLACGVFLLLRRSSSLCLTLSYLVTCVMIAWLFPYPGMSRLYSTAVQLSAGYVLFTGIFLINDPVTSPHFWLGRLFYGVFTGILVMLLQRIGRVEAGCCFAILIMNALSPIVDRWSWHVWHYFARLVRFRKEASRL